MSTKRIPWPVQVPVFTPEMIVRGTFEMGAKRCASGWIANVFTGEHEPPQYGPERDRYDKVASVVAKVAGIESADIIEWVDDGVSGRRPTKQVVAAVLNAAMAKLGYTEIVDAE